MSSVAVQTIQECGGGVLFLRFTYIKFDLFSKGLEFLPGLEGVRSFRLSVKALFLAYAATELATEPGVGVLMFDRGQLLFELSPFEFSPFELSPSKLSPSKLSLFELSPRKRPLPVRPRLLKLHTFLTLLKLNSELTKLV